MKRLLILGPEEICRDYVRAARREHYEVIAGFEAATSARGARGAPGRPNAAADRETVLEAAVRDRVSGILGIGCEAALTAAYVARQLELPGESYASVQLFRNRLTLWQFEEQHAFRVPNYRNITETVDLADMSWPLYVSPVDDTATQDTALVHTMPQLYEARVRARQRSPQGMVIAQECPIRETGEDGRSGIYLVSELIICDGVLQPMLLAECVLRRDHREQIMVGCRYPARLDHKSRTILVSECARLARLLHLQNAQISVLAYAAPGRTPYILSAGPGLSALRLPMFLSHLYGRDLYADMVRMVAGDPPLHGTYEMPAEGTFLAYYAVRAHCGGILRGIQFLEELRPYIVDWHCHAIDPARIDADVVRGQDLGRLVLRFESEERMEHVLGWIHAWILVEIDAW